MRKIAVITVIFAATALSGCATARLNSGLQKVLGEPIDVLVDAWGYPATQREIMGHTLYIWSNDGGVMAVPLYGGGMFAGRLQCQVEVYADDKHIIRSYNWNGNNGGCAPLARRLP